MTAANSQSRQTNINKFGPCFKISIDDYARFFAFKLNSEMVRLNNPVFFLILLEPYWICLRDQRQHANMPHGLNKMCLFALVHP